MKIIRTFAAAAAIAVAGAVSASAAVLTFDSGSGAPGTPYLDQGFKVTDNIGYIVADNGSMHFDIALGPYDISRNLTMASGGRFSVSALDIISLFAPGTPFYGAPMPDVSFVGYAGGSAVAWAWGSSEGGNNTVAFGPAFANIDRFTITGQWTGNFDWAAMGMPDIHFAIDNINVSPVPLPASLLMLLAGLGGLALAARSRRPVVAEARASS